MKKRKIYIKELVWDIIGGIFLLGGLSLIITHIVGSLLNCPLADNSIYQAEVSMTNWFKFRVTFLSLGFVIFLIGLLVVVLTLYHFAKKDDLVKERELKRKQRLDSTMSTPIQEEVVEVEATDVVKNKEE